MLLLELLYLLGGGNTEHHRKASNMAMQHTVSIAGL